MSFTLGLILAIVLLLLIVMAIVTIGENMVKISAKDSNLNPSSYSVLPTDLKSLIGLSKSKPEYVPEDENITYLKKGFDIKLHGEAEVADEGIPAVRTATYAIKPKDFVGMSPIPKLLVKEGDTVKAGDALFFDKYRPEIMYAAPVSGEVVAIRRAKKRSISEVVILADKAEMQYRNYEVPSLDSVSREELVAFLMESGAWPFIRQRPFDIVANHNQAPKAIFVSTFDSAPLAPDLNLAVQGREADFQAGLEVLQKLTEGTVHLGMNAKAKPAAAYLNADGVQRNWFEGKHPAGNVGVQIHHTDALAVNETVWHLDVHGVLVLGALFSKGVFDTERVVALTGNETPNNTYIRVHQGAAVASFLEGVNCHEATEEGQESNARRLVRVVSGDLLSGKMIEKDGFLGFFSDQLSTSKEGDYYELFGWLVPQTGHPTTSRTFPGGFALGTTYVADTNTNGEGRAMVVSGEYESVLPMDIYPQHLIRAIKANDFEQMQGLGLLELGEEDVALCEYVCTSKQPVQQIIREGLDFMREQG